MSFAGAMDSLCQRLIEADERYAEYLEHLEELYEKGAPEKEKEIAWVWLRQSQIERSYLQKSFAKDAVPLYAVSAGARDFR